MQVRPVFAVLYLVREFLGSHCVHTGFLPSMSLSQYREFEWSDRVSNYTVNLVGKARNMSYCPGP